MLTLIGGMYAPVYIPSKYNLEDMDAMPTQTSITKGRMLTRLCDVCGTNNRRCMDAHQAHAKHGAKRSKASK